MLVSKKITAAIQTMIPMGRGVWERILNFITVTYRCVEKRSLLQRQLFLQSPLFLQSLLYPYLLRLIQHHPHPPPKHVKSQTRIHVDVQLYPNQTTEEQSVQPRRTLSVIDGIPSGYWRISTLDWLILSNNFLMMVSKTTTFAVIQRMILMVHGVLVRSPIQKVIMKDSAIYLFVILVHACLHAGNPIMKNVVAPVPYRLRSAAERRMRAASVLI
mmetsp:Transcript_23840/g.51506  ORF Transcript_23840/g.51506 Transcript_23840/m.51506 type:complete len:215 (+) Transcript_23840:1221-1865(+)